MALCHSSCATNLDYVTAFTIHDGSAERAGKKWLPGTSCAAPVRLPSRSKMHTLWEPLGYMVTNTRLL